MPLRLWLPLDGTNENRGISGTVMTGSPNSWGNGRTGKCAVFNNNAAERITDSTTDYNYTVDDFSWCIWLKKDYSSMTSTSMYAFTVGRPDAGGRGYGLAALASSIRIWFGSKNYDVSGFPDNEWHHVAFTRKGTAIRIYKDGVLASSQTFNGTLPTYSDGGGPGVGCFHYTGNIYPLIGAVSDFRIYDHAMSAREVYQVSRALILHYPLCAPDNALPNMLTWAKNYTETTPYAHSSAAADGMKYLGNDTLVTVTPGKDYYIQVKSTAIPGTHATGGTAVTNNFTMYLYLRNQGTTKAVGGYDSPINLNKNNIFINDQVNQLYVWKWTAPSNAQDITLRTNSYSDGSTTVTLKFWDFKIEEGAYTSYVPSVNQAQYGELGYGSNIVRDATGRGNDSQLVVSEYSAGSPRYSSALNFSSPNVNYIWPIKDPINSATEEFTISMWVKPTDMSVDQFLWAGRTTGAHAVAIILQTTGKIHIDDSSRTTVTAGITANAWHHIVYAWKLGGNKVLYVNGVQKGSATAGTMDKSNTNACIGRKLTGATLESGNDFVGSMSDVRVYGTALSAADVNELYSTGAAIDNTGIVHSGSFEEIEPTARAEKTAMFYNSALTESGGTQLAYDATRGGNPIYPRTMEMSYVPTTESNSTYYTPNTYVQWSTEILRYHVSLDLEWSGFDEPALESTFNLRFQGQRYTQDGTAEWSTNYLTNALNDAAKPVNLITASPARGAYHYEVDFTIPEGHAESYRAARLGFRSDYSNGVGRVTCKHIVIYPADEHCDGMASITGSGGIRGRLVEEAEF